MTPLFPAHPLEALPEHAPLRITHTGHALAFLFTHYTTAFQKLPPMHHMDPQDPTGTTGYWMFPDATLVAAVAGKLLPLALRAQTQHPQHLIDAIHRLRATLDTHPFGFPYASNTLGWITPVAQHTPITPWVPARLLTKEQISHILMPAARMLAAALHTNNTASFSLYGYTVAGETTPPTDAPSQALAQAAVALIPRPLLMAQALSGNTDREPYLIPAPLFDATLHGPFSAHDILAGKTFLANLPNPA